MSLIMSPIVSSSSSGGGGGGGITSLNTDVTAAQLLTVGTAGTDFAITNPGGGSHVFNIPTASAMNRGLLSSTDWSTFNNKGSGTIGGTIAVNQIAVGSGVNTISGSSDLRWQSGTLLTHNGVDQNWGIGGGVLISNGASMASFNDAGSANIPMEYRATRHYFVKAFGELGNVSLRSQATTFPITIGDTLGPESDNSYDIGDSAHRIRTFYGANSDLSQDVTIGRNLIFTSSSENLLSAGMQLVNAGTTLVQWMPSAGMVWKYGATGAGGDRMYLTNDGKLGIGTVTPSTKLHVVGDTTIDGKINAFYSPGTNVTAAVYSGTLTVPVAQSIPGAFNYVTNSVTGDYAFTGAGDMTTFGGTTEAVIIGHIDGSGNTIDWLADNIGGVPTILGQAYNVGDFANGLLFTYNTTDVEYTRSGNSLFKIASTSRNVGINQTTPAERLHVVGNSRVDGRILGAKGADIASANDLTLGTSGNTFTITGNTQLNAIITTGWTAGSFVTLIFSGTPTVKNNTAGGAGTAPLFLAGSADLVAAANTVLGLVFDGTQWQETFRKVA